MHNLLLLGAIFLLLHLANLTEALSYVSRPLVAAVAGAFGLEAVDRGADIVIGNLVMPWTQDCSGVNTLVILWGITLWTNRERAFDRTLLLRLLLCVPAALLANTLRILTLAAYRYAFFPAWESEELHYLIGLLWLIPFLFAFVDDLRHMDRGRWIEILYLSLTLALLAPAIFSPGGSLVALCTLFYLAHSRVSAPAPGALRLAYLAWVLAAGLIAWADMESLWIAWLLLCPRLVATPLLFSGAGLIILSGTVSLLAMRPGWQVVVGCAIAWQSYRMLAERGDPPPAAAPRLGPVEPAAMALLGIAPFVLAGLIGVKHPVEQPPGGAMLRQLTFNSYQISLAGQPPGIRAYWYGAFGDGRHHALASCMRFRGVILEPVAGQQEVMRGAGLWMCDFFIHEGAFKASYGDYLLASFSPFSSPGVHLILDASTSSMSAAYFARTSDQLARRIYQLYLHDRHPGGSGAAARQ